MRCLFSSWVVPSHCNRPAARAAKPGRQLNGSTVPTLEKAALKVVNPVSASPPLLSAQMEAEQARRRRVGMVGPDGELEPNRPDAPRLSTERHRPVWMRRRRARKR